MSWQIDPMLVERAARAVAHAASGSRGLVSAQLIRVRDACGAGSAAHAALSADAAWRRCAERLSAAVDEHARELWMTAASFASTERAVGSAFEDRG